MAILSIEIYEIFRTEIIDTYMLFFRGCFLNPKFEMTYNGNILIDVLTESAIRSLITSYRKRNKQ